MDLGVWHEAVLWLTGLGPLLQCSSCSQQFMQKKDLQSHMIKLHGAPKPHAVSTGLPGSGGCECRGRPSASPDSSLTGSFCPQCPTCAKCFLSRTELQLHEAFKHRGEKLFVCEECGHRASSRNGLQMHIKAKHRCAAVMDGLPGTS